MSHPTVTMVNMAPPIRFPVAEVDGRLVWAADNAIGRERPAGTRCLNCSEPVNLRAGEKNRPHFAHGAACGAPESVLHRTTIRVIGEAIEAAVAAGERYVVSCDCARCLASRDANLARPGGTVDVDRVLADGIRPDLLIRKRSGAPLAVIEVVVTHSPEPEALAVYERHKLPLIAVSPTWDMLPELRHGLRMNIRRTADQPHGYDIGCRFPRHMPGPTQCPVCSTEARRLSVEIATADCYKCRRPFPVLDLIDCTDDELIGIAAGCPEVPSATAVAKQRGVRVALRASRAAGGSYLMHVCPSCNATQGDNFLYGGDQLLTDVTQPSWQMTACAAGHLEMLDEVPWPTHTRVERPRQFVGLVGEPAGHFAPRVPAPTMIRVTRANASAIARKMSGLDKF